MGETTPDVLYHYCSLDTFYNIMKNRSIWLSDVTKSNDSKELVWAIEKLIYFFEEKVKSYAASNSIELKEIQDTIQLIEEMRQYKYQGLLKSWVFCLSEKKDNLGQWRGYADDGKGICIGFKFNFLFQMKEYLEKQSVNTRCFFEKVQYDLPNNQLQKDISLNDFLESNNLDDYCYVKFSSSFIKLLKKTVLYKSKAFEEECEWRIGCDSNIYEISPHFFCYPSDNYFATGFGFSPRSNNELVSHIELTINDMKSAIASVTIGPKSNLTELDVKLLLVSLGLLHDVKDESIKVSRSSASYR